MKYQGYFCFNSLEIKESSCTRVELMTVAYGVCFALKSSNELLLLFTYLIFLCKDITFPLITKFKLNRSLSYLSVNQNWFKIRYK